MRTNRGLANALARLEVTNLSPMFFPGLLRLLKLNTEDYPAVAELIGIRGSYADDVQAGKKAGRHQ